MNRYFTIILGLVLIFGGIYLFTSIHPPAGLLSILIGGGFLAYSFGKQFLKYYLILLGVLFVFSILFFSVSSSPSTSQTGQSNQIQKLEPEILNGNPQ